MTITPIDSEPPCDDVVEKLELILADARAGKISSFAAGIVYRDGTVGSGWSSAHTIGTLIGSVAVLQADLIALLNDKD